MIRNSAFFVMHIYLFLFICISGCKQSVDISDESKYYKRNDAVKPKEDDGTAGFRITMLTPIISKKSLDKNFQIQINSISSKYMDNICPHDIETLLIEITRSDYALRFYPKFGRGVSGDLPFYFRQKKVSLPYTLKLPISKVGCYLEELDVGNYILQAKMYYRPTKSEIYSNEILLKIVE